MNIFPHAPRPNVLITSASRKVPLIRAMQEALARINPTAHVFAGDIDPQAIAQYAADGFWQMPHTIDSNLPSLINGCQERNIGVILPTRDGELTFWARHRETLLAIGIVVVISPPDSLARCLDKFSFAQFGQAQGLPMIATAEDPISVGSGPYVVKERFGAGSLGLGLALPLAAAQEHAKGLKEPLFQPYVTGPEISIDGWVDQKGDVLGVVLRRRDSVFNGESQISTTFRDDTLERQAHQVIQKLDLRGPVVMQAIVVEDNLQIIECNPRFGGASTTSIAVGLDMLHWSLREAFGMTPPPVFQRSEKEFRLARLPTDMVVPWS